jgi:hypothetical protein
MAHPIDAARNRRGSLLEQRLITQNVMAPGFNSLSPSFLETTRQPGGSMRNT